MADTNTQQIPKDSSDNIKQILNDELRKAQKKTIEEFVTKFNRRSPNLGQALNSPRGNAPQKTGATAGNKVGGEKSTGDKPDNAKNEKAEGGKQDEKQDEAEKEEEESEGGSEEGEGGEGVAEGGEDAEEGGEGAEEGEEKKSKMKEGEGEKKTEETAERGEKEGATEQPSTVAPENEREIKTEVDKSKKIAKDGKEAEDETEDTEKRTTATKPKNPEIVSEDSANLSSPFAINSWTTEALKLAWEDKYTGFLGWYGFSLLYINFHFIMSYFASSPSFCKFGDEKSKNISITDSEVGRIIIMLLADFLIIMLIVTLCYAGYAALPWLAKKCIENGDNWVGVVCTKGAKTFSSVITSIAK
jgi:hypothetical protein